MKCDVTDRDTRSEARCLENLLFRLVIFRGHCAKGFVYSIVAEGEESYHYSWLNLCRRLLIRRRHERQIESNEEAFLQKRKLNERRLVNDLPAASVWTPV